MIVFFIYVGYEKKPDIWIEGSKAYYLAVKMT